MTGGAFVRPVSAPIRELANKMASPFREMSIKLATTTVAPQKERQKVPICWRGGIAACSTEEKFGLEFITIMRIGL